VFALETFKRHIVAPISRRRGRSGAAACTRAIVLAALLTAPAATAKPAAHHGKPHRGSASGGCAAANTPANHASAHAMRAATLCLINGERSKRHLPSLTELRRLDRAAQGWTDAMVNGGFFSHSGSGSDPGARISAQRFSWSAVGENIATGYATPRDVVQAWLASTDHCQNVLAPTFSYVGIGVNRNPVGGFASGPGTWTADFGLPAGASAPSGNWGPAHGCPY
jgi:uncharacterized protein YkwD